MAPNTAAELSLINDAEFLGELQAFAPETDGGFDQETRPRLTGGDAYDALESGLPAAALTAAAGDAPHEFVPVDEPDDDDNDRLAASATLRETRVTFIAAALVLAACLAAGAVTAAFVFHDRVAQITASR